MQDPPARMSVDESGGRRSSDASTTSSANAAGLRSPAEKAKKAAERAAAVRARGQALAAEERERRAKALEAKSKKIEEIGAAKKRDGAYASSTSALSKSPVKPPRTTESVVATTIGVPTTNGAVKKQTATVAGAAQPEWVSPVDSPESATPTSSSKSSKKPSKAEIERAVRACVAEAIERVVAAKPSGIDRTNANAATTSTSSSDGIDPSVRACVAAAVQAVVDGPDFVTPTRSAKSRGTRGVTPASNKSKSKGVMGSALANRLEEARAQRKEIEAELKDSPLRSPYKARLKKVDDSPLARLQNAIKRLARRVKHRAEKVTEKHPRKVAGGVLGFAVLVLVTRGGQDPVIPAPPSSSRSNRRSGGR